MACRDIMIPPPVTLTGATPIRDALKSLLSTKLTALPVVDDAGRCIGMFSLHTLVGAVLPRAATIAADVDLSFVTDSVDVLRSRLEAVIDHRVEQHLEGDLPKLTPDTALVEAVLMMYRRRRVLPVVDEAGKLLGIVTTWAAIARVAEGL